MSPREQIQTKLVNFLEVNANQFNAPYGILTSLDSVPNNKGRVRTVTFGMARWLDCSVYIWSVNRITVRAAGSQSFGLDGMTFKSMDELINVLKGKLWMKVVRLGL